MSSQKYLTFLLLLSLPVFSQNNQANIGINIAEYTIYVNDNLIGHNINPRTMIVDLKENTQYSITVAARNTDNLTSEKSDALLIKTTSFEGLSAYPQRSDSLIVIEAENASNIMTIDNISWEKKVLTGAANSRALRAAPNSGKFYRENIEMTSPRADYYIFFEDTGAFYILCRASTNGNTDNDEVHFGLDGQLFESTNNVIF